jgi:hypothetical protein
MAKRTNSAPASVAASVAAPAIASVRDGGLRASKLHRDLTQFGAQMLAIWPELATNYAEGNAQWANFDTGAMEAWDASREPVYAKKGDDGIYRTVPTAADYTHKITAAWLKARDKKTWAAMKKDDLSLYEIAAPINRTVNVAIAEARRVLKIAVSKALAATTTKTKSGNRTIGEYVRDVATGLESKIKTGLANKSITPEQAKVIRDWIAAKPTV